MSNNENENINLSAAYLKQNIEAMSTLVDTVKNAMDSFIVPQIDIELFDTLAPAISQLTSIFDDLFETIDISGIQNACKQLILQFDNIALPSYDLSSLADNITIEDDYVILADDAVETLTNVVNINNEVLPAKIKSKMSLESFLVGVVLPIALLIFQLIYDNYQNKLDSLESQRQQLQDAEYYEAILNIETQQTKELDELNSNINELLRYLESAQDTHSPDANIPPLLDEIQEVTLDSLAVDCEAEGASDNHDVNQSSN